MIRQSRKALSLLELVVVLTILAVLAALTVPMLSGGHSSGVVNDAQVKVTQATLRELQQVILNRYAVEMAGMIATSTNHAIRAGLPGPHPDHLDAPASQSSLGSRPQRPQLCFLFVNPASIGASGMTPNALTYNINTARGWRGPYVTAQGTSYPGLDPNQDAAMRGFTADYGYPRTSAQLEDGDPTVLDGWGNPIVIALNPNRSYKYWSLFSAGPDSTLTVNSTAADGSDDMWLDLIAVP